METSETNKLNSFEAQEPLLYDHPSTIEVANQRRNWNQIISKYREKVHESKPSPSTTNIGNMGKDQSKTETKKGSKKAKNGSGDDVESIDWVTFFSSRYFYK